jgi:hypothetical protein
VYGDAQTETPDAHFIRSFDGLLLDGHPIDQGA